MKSSGKKTIKVVGIVTTGASELVKVKGGYELRIYTNPKDAVALGMDPQLARHVFAKRAGKCKGGCSRFENQKGTHTWCVDINCTGVGSCACHLISMWKNKDDEIEEEDHGTDFDQKSPHKKIPGRVYACRCQ